MGMRATVAFVDKDQSVKLTSVQWSTRLDQTLGHMAAQARNADQDPGKVIAGLFRMITSRWNHISAIEVNDEPGDRDVVMGHQITVNFPQKHEPQKRYSSRKNIDIYNYHLDGGSIGAIYDVSTPDIIEFFWDDPQTNMVKTRKCSINALANFYSDVFAKPNKLKNFSHRNY